MSIRVRIADSIKRAVGIGVGEWTSKHDFAPDDEYLDAWGLAEERAFLSTSDSPGLLSRGLLSLVHGGRIDWRLVLAGVPKVVYIDGWLRRGSPVMNPKAILCHWDASRPTSKNLAPSKNIIINGRDGIPGPLAHLYVALDGTIFVIASGRANHAGRGNVGLLDRIRQGLPPLGTAASLKLRDTGGFGGSLIGIEIANTVGVPLAQAQLSSMGNIARATRQHLGFNLSQSCQWAHINTTRRKIDLDAVKMAQILQASR